MEEKVFPKRNFFKYIMTYADARLMSKGICVHDTGSFNSGIVIIICYIMPITMMDKLRI
jgi:hypothetical protein